MVTLPPELPKPYIDLCWEIRREFRPGLRQGDGIASAVERAVQAGADEIAVRSLLVGLEAGQVWIREPERTEGYEKTSKVREKVRHKRKTPFFNKLFEFARDSAGTLSIRGVKEIQSLIIFGFALHHGHTRMHTPHWRPLAQALASILNDDNEDDLEERICERMRIRIQRIRNKPAQNKVRRMAAAYFNGVYATLERTRRMRTYRERTR